MPRATKHLHCLRTEGGTGLPPTRRAQDEELPPLFPNLPLALLPPSPMSE